MTTSELLPAFEAVLFAGGEPLSIDRFAQVFSVTPENVVAVMEKLEKKLSTGENGIELVRRKNFLLRKAVLSLYVWKIHISSRLKKNTPLT